jgi:hypothetical protein
LLEYLRCQSNSTLAGLYALYRLGDYLCSAAEAARRYRYSYELADQPIHHPHAAADLVAKAPLARGFRRGLEYLGLPPLLQPSQVGDELHPVTQLED